MSIPGLDSAWTAGSYAHTIRPALHLFVPHLKQFFGTKRSSQAILNWLTSKSIDPFEVGLGWASLISVVVYIISEVNTNYSQVDRIWSMLPTSYSVLWTTRFWLASGKPLAQIHSVVPHRLLLMTALQLMWSTRLTYNYWRRGGYQKGSEDYRWQIVQKGIGTIGMKVLNITFIAPLQNLLLLIVSLPSYVVTKAAETYPSSGATMTLSIFDWVIAGLVLSCLITETIADEQQWRFQTEKHKLLKERSDWEKQNKSTGDETQAVREGKPHLSKRMARGFRTDGLFKYSRHPNFLAEQAFWWSNYLFTIPTTGLFLNFAIFGPLFYTILFISSTLLTESITANKYPLYSSYQSRVSRFFPLKYLLPFLRTGGQGDDKLIFDQ